MPRAIVKIIATKGKQKITYKTQIEAAYAFNVNPNMIQSACANGTKMDGWKLNKIREGKNRCLSCNVELNNQDDEYCMECYYKELTGKPLRTAETINRTTDTNIIYPTQGHE